ncbi:MAG: glutaredoxin family protein [Pseudomonadales bacterium]|nr:glutaredoxin family protein [Pseudomonadales bacterium]
MHSVFSGWKPEAVIVQLYTTLGCHLCELAEELLMQALRSGISFSIEATEISNSDELIERYGIRIPVIRCNGSDRELGWPFSLAQLQLFLQEEQGRLNHECRQD